MSSTNRGRERNANDYYRTPVDDVMAFLKESGLSLDNQLIYDPCSGGDVNNDMSYPAALSQWACNSTVVTSDIREDSPAEYHIDYLNDDFVCVEPDVIISNPPFKDSLEFVERALENVREGGLVIFLLRLSFLESLKRKDFLQANMPEKIFVHAKRMSFTEDGKTDSVAYAHFVWRKGYHPEYSLVKVI